MEAFTRARKVQKVQIDIFEVKFLGVGGGGGGSSAVVQCSALSEVRVSE